MSQYDYTPKFSSAHKHKPVEDPRYVLGRSISSPKALTTPKKVAKALLDLAKEKKEHMHYQSTPIEVCVTKKCNFFQSPEWEKLQDSIKKLGLQATNPCTHTSMGMTSQYVEITLKRI